MAVAVDRLGRRLGEVFIEATAAGYAQLLTWADPLGGPATFEVEAQAPTGVVLPRFLRREGRKVIEVSRPSRREERRGWQE